MLLPPSCREARTPRKAELGAGSCSMVLGEDKQDGVAGKSTLLRRCQECSWQLCHPRSRSGGQAGMAAPQPGWGQAQAAAGTCWDQFATGAAACRALFCSLPVPQAFSTGL